MYKYFSALIIVVSMVIITGCGSKKTDNTPTSDTAKKKTEGQVKEPEKTGGSFRF